MTVGRNENFLQKAEELKPVLNRRVIYGCSMDTAVDFRGESYGAGAVIRLDFGNHMVGKLTLKLGYSGSHPDAPVWLRLKFAERECELSEDAERYHGWISKGWIQQEQLHVDVLPTQLELPRRYAFRYLQIEVLDVSSKYCLRIEDAWCTAETSANDELLKKFHGTARQEQMDRVACHTLRECMQGVFEDGPKRDRRLWLGDLRMQALANYQTFQKNDLVKRCLYLFAGTTLENGGVGACLFTEPEIQVDDTRMFDYSLLFIPTLLDYYEATGDLETLRELSPTAFRQVELVQTCFDEMQLVKDSDVLGWCFVDWNLHLNKQASAQGIYLFCVLAAEKIAGILGQTQLEAQLRKDYLAKQAAAECLWDARRGLYVSGAEKQVSWASQVWMVLGGAVHGNAELLARMEGRRAEQMVTPYMYHNYVDALFALGQDEKALRVLEEYWGGMLDQGADTFWELYNPQNPEESPYGGTVVNSYCHAWSCAPAYFLRKIGNRTDL